MKKLQKEASRWEDPVDRLKRDGDLPYDAFVSFRLDQVSTLLERQWSRIVRGEADISLSEWRMLAVLQGGPRLFSDLVDATGINKGLCSRSATRLQQLNFVQAEPVFEDARRVVLALTAKGMRLVEKIKPKAVERQSVLLSALTAAERRALYKAFGKLTAAAQAFNAPDGEQDC